MHVPCPRNSSLFQGKTSEFRRKMGLVNLFVLDAVFDVMVLILSLQVSLARYEKCRCWASKGEIAGDQVLADVWKKGVWDFQAKSGSSDSCRLFLHFQGKSGKKKEHKPKLFWAGYLPVEWGSSMWKGWGRKVRHVPRKHVPRNQGKPNFLGGISWEFLLVYPGGARKV